ncbi:hypothetical protein KIW84_023995 [Lathyrus oleraceus]|uniref:Helitron helicase-like domain-containing protein n=1 Tax=Pisum sativum TaxID=3888 RepID=A0A9D4YEE9_PEA|nr:hypothetical protein KIW84_023995 [Pisum sativum]
MHKVLKLHSTEILKDTPNIQNSFSITPTPSPTSPLEPMPPPLQFMFCFIFHFATSVPNSTVVSTSAWFCIGREEVPHLRYHAKLMASPVEDVRDINDSKDLWKIAVRIRGMWFVKSVSNKEHLEMILVDARYKLEVLGVDGKFREIFVLWNNDCVKLMGKFVLKLKRQLIEAGEYNPFEFPYPLDAILKKELTIRVFFQPKYGRLSVVGFRDNKESRKKIRDNLKSEEKPMSTSADYDPDGDNSGISLPSENGLLLGFKPELMNLVVNYEGADKGERVVLPSNYVGSQRFMGQLYFDGMEISSQIGFLDIFITFTCNPNWPEVQRFLSNINLQPQDRSNIISRVFKIKFDEMLYDLTKKHVLGKLLVYLYTIELQKCGLQNAHILLFLHNPSKNQRWRRHKRGYTIGRMIWLPPSKSRLYYLRMILTIVKGPTCYKDIKDVSGKVLDSFRDACFEMGFLEDNNEYVAAINEAKDWGSRQLRKLFVTMLISSMIN